MELELIEKQIDELFDPVHFDFERKALQQAVDAVKSGVEHEKFVAKHSLTLTFMYNQKVTVRQINVAANLVDLL